MAKFRAEQAQQRNQHTKKSMKEFIIKESYFNQINTQMDQFAITLNSDFIDKALELRDDMKQKNLPQPKVLVNLTDKMRSGFHRFP